MSKYPSRSVSSPSETLRHTGQRNGAKSSVDFMVDTIYRNFAPKWPPFSFSFVVTQVCCVDVEEDEDRVHYDGYQVIRALPDSQDQLDTLHTIGECDIRLLWPLSKLFSDSEDSVEGWTPVSGMAGNVTTVDLLLSPKQIRLVKSFLNCNNIQYSIVLHDLQRAIGDYWSKCFKSGTNATLSSFNCLVFQILRMKRNSGGPLPLLSSRARVSLRLGSRGLSITVTTPMSSTWSVCPPNTRARLASWASGPAPRAGHSSSSRSGTGSGEPRRQSGLIVAFTQGASYI